MKTFTMLVDRQLQNDKGKAIVDFKAYFYELLKQVGYIKAKEICRKKLHIFVVIT